MIFLTPKSSFTNLNFNAKLKKQTLIKTCHFNCLLNPKNIALSVTAKKQKIKPSRMNKNTSKRVTHYTEPSERTELHPRSWMVFQRKRNATRKRELKWTIMLKMILKEGSLLQENEPFCGPSPSLRLYHSWFVEPYSQQRCRLGKSKLLST